MHQFQEGAANDSLRGPCFQVKILMHLAHHAALKGDEFELGSELKGYEKFDDLYFNYNNRRFTLAQVKYCKNTQLLLPSQLFEDKKFGLYQYFKSYQHMPGSFTEKSELMLITNKNFDLELIKIKNRKPYLFSMTFEYFKHRKGNKSTTIYFEKMHDDELFGAIGECYCLMRKRPVSSEILHKYYMDTFTVLQDYFHTENKKNPSQLGVPKFSKKLTQDFLSKFSFVINVSETKINEILGNTISHNLKLKNVDFLAEGNEAIFINYLMGNKIIKCDDLLNCFKKWENVLQTQNLIGLKKDYVEKLEKTEIKFKNVPEKIKNFLRSNEKILVYSTKITEFAAIKVYQAVAEMKNYAQEDSYLMLSPSASPSSFRKAIETFCKETSFDLIVIEWNHEILNSVYYQMFESSLFEAVTTHPSKKIIFITRPQNIQISCDSYELYLETESDKASDVTIESFEYYHGKQIEFQNQTIKLKELFEATDYELVSSIELLDLKNVQSIGKNISVHKTFEENLFIERNLRCQGLEISVEKFLKHNNKIAILSDVAGNGKSNLFNYLAKKLKAQNPQKWIIKIDLNEHTRELKEMADIRFDDKQTAIKILSEKIIKTNEGIERQLFNHSFNRNARIILFFDGFDEACPYYKQIVINLLQILKQTKIEKIFISTRPELQINLEEEFKEIAYSICPFGDSQRKEFLMKYYQLINLEVDDIEAFIDTKLSEILLIENLQQLTSTPLITRMLAESLEKSMENPKKCIEIFDIYQNFLQKKYDIFFEKSQQDISNIYIRYGTDYILSSLKECHYFLAIKQLFNDEIINELKLLQDLRYNDNDYDFVLKCGIVQGCKEDAKFIHKTFAEHHFSLILVEKLDNECIMKFLLNHIFVEKEYYMIRIFLNGRLLEPNETIGKLLKDKDFGQIFQFLKLLITEKTYKNFNFFHNSLFNLGYKEDKKNKAMELYSKLLHKWKDDESFGSFLTCLKALSSDSIHEKIIQEEDDKSILCDMKILKWFYENTSREFFVSHVVRLGKPDANSTLFDFAELFEWEKFWCYTKSLEWLKEKLGYNFIKNIVLLDKRGRSILYFVNYLPQEEIHRLLKWLKEFLSKSDFEFILKLNDEDGGSFLHFIYRNENLMTSLKWLNENLDKDQFQKLIFMKNKFSQTILFKETSTLSILEFLKKQCDIQVPLFVNDFYMQYFCHVKTNLAGHRDSEDDDNSLLAIINWIKINLGFDTVKTLLITKNEENETLLTNIVKNWKIMSGIKEFFVGLKNIYRDELGKFELLCSELRELLYSENQEFFRNFQEVLQI